MESHNPYDFPSFTKILPETFINNKLKLLENLLSGNQVNPTLAVAKAISVDKSGLADIVDMVERRRVYLYVFHGIDMSEYNEIALYCFWILKFQPFYPIGGNKKTASEINAHIAYSLLSSCVNSARNMKGKPKITLNLNTIIHAFRYQDISKEAIMLLMASLIEA
jgi:hypothetical protein